MTNPCFWKGFFNSSLGKQNSKSIQMIAREMSLYGYFMRGYHDNEKTMKMIFFSEFIFYFMLYYYRVIENYVIYCLE